jgi:glycosyltransferase involved in cell wall biosynthesis
VIPVLVAHNRYQQPGGEDSSTDIETRVLSSAGHRVVEYVRDNGEIAAYGLWHKGTLGLRTVWAWDSYREIRRVLRAEKPHVAHFQNTFPLISPAAYYACREAGVPVVQTLHNYRLLCPAATLQNDGRVCEDCLGRSPWRGVPHACYRDSRAATAAVALVHRWLGTWSKMVDCYIALTQFARAKFIEGGLPAEKIVVKPNFVHPDPMAVNHQSPITNHQFPDYALFVGRLSPEKGVRTLLAAWQRLGSGIPLRVVGDGPLRAELEAQVSRLGLSRVWRGKPAATSISFPGHLTPDHLTPVLKSARFLVFPSECYEGMPRTIIEAYACGVPVIASRLGAMQEIVEDGRTGLHFTPGDADDLAAKVDWAWTHPDEMQEMGRAARAEYEFKYTAERNYQMLMEIYQKVIGDRSQKSGARIQNSAIGNPQALAPAADTRHLTPDT